MQPKPFTFFLGVPESCWLDRSTVPMMLSRRRSARIKHLKPGRAPFLFDSSGFTELDEHGCWTFSDEEYVEEVQRVDQQIGNLQAAAIKDWMCEPWILRKTGLTVLDHQRNTVASYLSLSKLAPTLPWMPVIQGWTVADYLRCVELYAAEGIDLAAFPLVGVGTLCRRQSSSDAYTILEALSDLGLKLHGFGFKTDGLPACHRLLASSDSMAWSKDAQYAPPLPDCTHKNCANCLAYALLWRKRVIALCAKPSFGKPLPPPPCRRRRAAAAGQLALC